MDNQSSSCIRAYNQRKGRRNSLECKCKNLPDLFHDILRLFRRGLTHKDLLVANKLLK